MPPKGPFPRQYEIIFTLHLKQRSALREIAKEIVEEVVRTGSERPKPGRGVKGGIYVEFSKKIELRTIIVIAELLGQQCHILTTYEKEPDPTRN